MIAVLGEERLTSLGFTRHLSGGTEFLVPPMVPIPAGKFLMGSAKADGVRAYEDEFPQHEVETEAFEIAKFPVTVAEYACAVQTGAVGQPLPFRGTTWADQLTKSDHPVTSVSWLDAMSYCLWLSDLTDELWTLPTEAEWEKAARGEDGRIYPWGNDWDSDRTNTPESGIGHTTAVDAFPDGLSPYGLWDQVGNVWEWCTSIYRPFPYVAADGREDLTVIVDRILKGSAWYCTPMNARAACRGIGYAGMYLGGGFRLARHVSQLARPV